MAKERHNVEDIREMYTNDLRFISSLMKILHSWLREFTDVGDDVEVVAAALTKLGLAVECRAGGYRRGWRGGGQVLRTQAHPDTAKVHRVYVMQVMDASAIFGVVRST